MVENAKPSSWSKRIKDFFLGAARSPFDSQLFHKLSLTAFLAWIGLGSDGITSSCYGPEQAYLALGTHTYLSVFVGLATAVTIFVISASYIQIIETFPAGGGGYIVASRLLTPTLGMISGCALIIDYILTITISIASGIDAIFSFLPPHWQGYKLAMAAVGIGLLTLMNLRGVKESVMPLIPIFLVFMLTHIFAILYAIFTHLPQFPVIAQGTITDMHETYSSIGFWGLMGIMLRAYTMGAGTYTGIEAVSNGMPVLREPRVETAKKTMTYMAVSLATLVAGLMISYIFYKVDFQFGKTANAVFFERMTAGWGAGTGKIFVLSALVAEALLLFAAAQTGFLGGPRVLANMAEDRWFPSRFAILSDRLVTGNGILMMSLTAVAILIFTRGSVASLVILYSINVFITFVLSQLGMIRHWWNVKHEQPRWLKKMFVNGIGFVLTTSILLSMIFMKFHQGGWLTLVITGALVAVAVMVKRHYYETAKLLRRLNNLVAAANASMAEGKNRKTTPRPLNAGARTAVIFVNGYNGLGLHTLFNVIRYFGDTFTNFIFIQIGVLDSSNFKSEERIRQVNGEVQKELTKYVNFMQQQGYATEGISAVGVSIQEEAVKMAPQILERFPQAIFFGGQLSFRKNFPFSKILHNYTVFTLQKQFYDDGIPFFILPIRI